jgi:hypothetical protein
LGKKAFGKTKTGKKKAPAEAALLNLDRGAPVYLD